MTSKQPGQSIPVRSGCVRHGVAGVRRSDSARAGVYRQGCRRLLLSSLGSVARSTPSAGIPFSMWRSLPEMGVAIDVEPGL